MLDHRILQLPAGYQLPVLYGDYHYNPSHQDTWELDEPEYEIGD